MMLLSNFIFSQIGPTTYTSAQSVSVPPGAVTLFAEAKGAGGSLNTATVPATGLGGAASIDFPNAGVSARIRDASGTQIVASAGSTGGTGAFCRLTWI